MNIEGIDISWLGHAAFKIKLESGKIAYIDPFKLEGEPEKADFIFITHEHYDHLDMESINKIRTKNTILVATNVCQAQLESIQDEFKYFIYLIPDELTDANEIKVETIHAYNTNKKNDKGELFHPPEKNHCGYLMHIDGKLVYHCGDTDNVPELAKLTERNVDVALIPCSGTYVMTAEEAAKAADVIKAKTSIPMHYGSIVGTEEDAKKFKELVKETNALIPTK